MTVLVTGGAGFIGCDFVLDCLGRCDERVLLPKGARGKPFDVAEVFA